MPTTNIKPLTFADLQVGKTSFQQTFRAQGITRTQSFYTIFEPDYSLPALPLVNPINWRANGKLKTWKTRPEDFKLPIKHGLRDFGYITEENIHLFSLKE